MSLVHHEPKMSVGGVSLHSRGIYEPSRQRPGLLGDALDNALNSNDLS